MIFADIYRWGEVNGYYQWCFLQAKETIRTRRYLGTVLVIALIVLPGCLEFTSIEQPSSVRPGEMFTVSIEVAVEFDEDGSYSPRIAVRLPDGWTIPGNSFVCTGVYDQEIVFDPNLVLTEEELSPSPEGYHWWVGVGNAALAPLNGTVYTEIPIQTDEQTGLYFLDYTLGYSDDLVNDRSNKHLIEVVDEYTPRELRAAVNGNIVLLSWIVPSVIEGFIGYNLYRDGQLINTELIEDTAYSDMDLPGGVFHYSVSSLYENGSEHITPYEINAIIFSGGTGEPNAPYQIALAEQLVTIADFPDLLDKYFVLNSDIDLDPNLQGGQIFNKAVIPIFSGTFDGHGYTIQHLTIEALLNQLGLFGVLECGGQVWNLGIKDVNITSSGSFVSGLVGRNYGDLNSCYVTGVIMSKGSAGGLVGWNEGSITTSYSSGFVSGENSVGGLVGNNEGSIVSCYSTVAVTGSSSFGGLVGNNNPNGQIATSYSTGLVSGRFVSGGLVGNNDGSVNASFWDIQSAGQAVSDGGAGLTTDEMMDPFMVGLNGLANDPNWVLDAGRDYPRLAWEGMPGVVVPAEDMSWLEGQGTAESPYRIDTADQLILLGKASILWDRHFLLGTNVDLNPALRGRQIFEQAVIPVFAGIFDGGDHVISNLRIEGTRKLGLFGTLTSDAEVRNIGITGVQIDVTSYWGAGGLVGINKGSIISSHSTGTITGYDLPNGLGGLVGYNSGNITMSFSTVTVKGGFDVGGLVGSNDGSIVSSHSNGSINGRLDIGGLVGSNIDEGSIVSCYSSGSVVGDKSPWGPVGGLVGSNFGSIAMSYSSGPVSGRSFVGGLVGRNDESVDASFWDIQSSGQTASSGGTGMTTSEMQMTDTFLSAGWDFIDESANGVEDIWWILEEHDYPRLWWEADRN